jgi:acetyl esterase
MWFWDQYVPDAARRSDPYVNVLASEDLSGLPPTHVITAEYDPLRDEGEAYAARLEAAGVPVTHTRYDGMIHGFLSFSDFVDKAKQALLEAAAILT